MPVFSSGYKLIFAAILLFSAALFIRAADSDPDTAEVFNDGVNVGSGVGITLEDLAIDVFYRITNEK